MTQQFKTMNNFETIINCYLNAHVDNLNISFLIDNKISIYELKKIAKVTFHDFRLRNSKKNKLISMKEKLKETIFTTIRRKIDRLKIKQTRENNDV